MDESPATTPKPVIGLVGGIGSGKSFVADLLKERGGHVIVADQLGHEALREPDVKAKVIARWGRKILNEADEVDRRQLASIVFADPDERRKLEELVFPYIGGRIREEIEAARADRQARFIVLDAAILLETDWGRSCDKIVFVAAPRATRLSRLAGRGWSEKEVEAREQAQLSLEEKRARAQAVIDNGGDAANTRRQVDELLDRWRLLRDPSARRAGEG